MFEELYAPIPDLEKTLERIGLENFKCKNDVQSLDTLAQAYATHVPYENLLISYEHKMASLAIEDLYDKIVVRKRGGYCFEMNGFFWALLRDLGFEVYSVSVYVRENRDFLGELQHRANIVDINGHKYFVDVGFGGKSTSWFGVPMDGTIKNNFFVKYDNIKREYTLCRIADKEFEEKAGNGRFVLNMEVSGQNVDYKEITMFRDFIAYPQEFILPNQAVFYDKVKRIIICPVANIKRENGDTFTVFDDVFKGKTSEGRFERKIKDEKDLLEILEKYFGIVL